MCKLIILLCFAAFGLSPDPVMIGQGSRAVVVADEEEIDDGADEEEEADGEEDADDEEEADGEEDADDEEEADGEEDADDEEEADGEDGDADDEEDEDWDGVVKSAENPPTEGALGLWHQILLDNVESITEQYGDSKVKGVYVRAQVSKAADRTLMAVKALHEAQTRYAEACIQFSLKHGTNMDNAEIGRIRANFQACVDACLKEDLRALLSCNVWTGVGNDAIPLRKEGGKEVVNRFRLKTPFSDRTCWNYRDVHFVLAHEGVYQKKLLGMYTQAIKDQYIVDKDSDAEREPLTQGVYTPGEEMAEELEELCNLFAEAEKAWEDYCNALSGFCAPFPVLRAGGSSDFAVEMTGRVRETHLRYLAQVNCGFLENAFDDESGTVACSPGRYRFGEIVSENGVLFRNPDLPGSPWCIIFHRPGVCTEDFLYYIVPPCKALDTYLADNPEGGPVDVTGYMDVQCSGKPFPKCGLQEYTVSVVFRLESISREEFRGMEDKGDEDSGQSGE